MGLVKGREQPLTPCLGGWWRLFFEGREGYHRVMHDIMKHRRGCWPDAVESILNSVNGFEAAIVADSELRCEARQVYAGIDRLAMRPELVLFGASELVRGLLWYAVDALPQAHAIFQEESGFLGSYCHGMMHRREGDFWNANYWFRLAGKPPAGVFGAGFMPERLTSACEQARHDLRSEDVLEGLAREAACILDYLFRVG